MVGRQTIYRAAAPALGFAGQIGQMVLLRELLMVFHGNEMAIGLMLASWLVWVGAGSRLGIVCAERTADPVRLLRRCAAATLLLLPGTVLAVRLSRSLFPVLPGAYLSLTDLFLSCLLALAPVCLLLGLQFVLLSRVRREAEGLGGTVSAGKTYIGEALGAVLGGFLFAFLLVRRLDALPSAALSGALLLAAVLALPGTGRGTAAKRQTVRILSGILVLALTFAACPWLGRLDAWASARQWEAFVPGHRLIEVGRSKYGALAVTRRAGQFSFFQSGHLLFSAAGEETGSPELEELEGVALAHLALVQHPDPRRILLVGGGLRGTLREILRHPVERVDYIEIDEVLTAMARRYLPTATLEALDDPRCRLLHTDGRLFLKTSGERYDLLIIDVPDPATALLNRYYTEEFFREARARLRPGGVICVSAQSVADLRGPEAVNRNATLFHTLRGVFDHVLPLGGRHLVFFGTQAPDRLSADPGRLIARFEERAIEGEGFSPLYFATLLQEDPLRRINWILRHHGRRPGDHLRAPERGPLFPDAISDQMEAEAELPPADRRYFINTDFKPIAYYYTLLFWNAHTRGDRAGAALQGLIHVRPWWLLLPPGLAFLAVWSMRRRPLAVARAAVWLAVFTSGLSTMALQIVLLLAFQSLYGFVYEMAGFIVGLFMTGLVLGAQGMRRLSADRADPRLLAWLQVVVALFAVLLPLALPAAAAATRPAVLFALFSLLTVLAGALNGADYPLAAACFMALTSRADRSAGTIYGAELAGGALGAAVAGAALAPVLGLAGCCLLAAAANAAAAGALAVSGRFKAG